MNRLTTASTAIGVILMALISIGCSNDSEAGEHSSDSEGVEQSGAEHSGDVEASEHTGDTEASAHDGGAEASEHTEDTEAGAHDGGAEEGEESGVQLELSETFDEVRAGARLILSYDSTDNLFKGTVENTTDSTLRRVRVEVHLSNGIELGPTTPVDIWPGRMIDVILTATGDPFTSWSAHAEVN